VATPTASASNHGRFVGFHGQNGRAAEDFVLEFQTAE
jgi:hypothetical protein